MKITLAQINPTVGDIGGNVKKILNVINTYEQESDIIVFPEMITTGYPPQDLLFESNFISSVESSLSEIKRSVNQCTVVLGTIRKEKEGLYNAAAIIHPSGKIEFRYKSLLPTYDVFDEARYFTPAVSNEPVDVVISDKSHLIGVQICEDLWDDAYSQKVTSELAAQGAQIIINISASPFSVDRIHERINTVSQKVKSFKIPFVYCNMVGAQDELVFDGQSFAIDENEKLISQCNAFDEDVLTFDLNEKIEYIKTLNQPEEEQIYHALTLGLKDYFNKTSHNTAIIGLSGGIDSALTAAIAQNALGKRNVYGISMPSQYSSDHSKSDAQKLAELLGIQFEQIPIKSLYDSFTESLSVFFQNTESGLAEENLQARIRGNLLMAIANKKNALVLNTGNKTESALGYCTMYGDMCGALSVISDLNKSQVYKVCKWINKHYKREIIPNGTITKPPSAELRPNQLDPFDYEVVSPLVDSIVTENLYTSDLTKEGFDINLSKDLIDKVRLSEYKRRQSAPGIRISKKAFGMGRRYPIVNRFKE